MPSVIFARPRHDYASYRDYYRLIELSGYELLFFDEIDPSSDNTYIMTILNGENQGGWVDPRARIILFDLEWRMDNPPRIPGVEAVWAADAWYAEQIGARYVPFGSDERLADQPIQPNGHYDYDVATLAYTGPTRRSLAFNAMIEQGLTLSGNAWGDERDAILRHSRSMVHVHQLEGVNTIAPQRFALAAAYALPLISERLYNPGIFRYSHILSSDYAHIADFARMWLCQYDAKMLMDYGWNLHYLLCRDYQFRKVVEGAV